MKIALSIAGFDPSCGAGVQADIKTFSSLGIYGVSVLTAITIQNTQEVERVYGVSAEIVRRQIECILKDFSILGVKIGMLYTPENIKVVSDILKEYSLRNIVLDPVVMSSSGTSLLLDGGLEEMKERLLPMVDLITPNLREASLLSGEDVKDIGQMEWAARKISRLGVRMVVVTGGHIGGRDVPDVFFDGRRCHRLFSSRIEGRDPHGTGCAYSSSIVALRCRGMGWLDAVARAKDFVARAISKSFKPGQGAFVLC